MISCARASVGLATAKIALELHNRIARLSRKPRGESTLCEREDVIGVVFYDQTVVMVKNNRRPALRHRP
jgi:hypothetical protein